LLKYIKEISANVLNINSGHPLIALADLINFPEWKLGSFAEKSKLVSD
jgi:hypothetical protein